MSVKRFTRRVKSAKLIGKYRLLEHQLKFHKIGKDNSGKCDAYFTGNKTNIIFGILFDFDIQEKPKLDKFEHLGIGYQQKQIKVISQHGDKIDAYTYYAITINPKIKPFSWYKQHIIYGAKEANLPADYLSYIINYPDIRDSNRDREKSELSIYRN
jgi:hypothetical protein